MIPVSALAFAILEILGLGVVALEEGGVLALGPETLIVGDVLAVGGGAPLVSWCGGGLPEPELDTRCFLGEPRIAVRRWSPELGPLGLTTWITGTVAESWPFLELVPGGEPRRFTLYWKETVEAPEGGLTAVLRWRELAVPE